MRNTVVAVLLLVAAFATARELSPMLRQGPAGPSGVVEQQLDPRIEALNQQMDEAYEAGNAVEAKRLGCQVQQILLEQQRPVQPGAVRARPVWKAPARGRADPPDVLIHSGSIVAFATDYEMDGTMWTAVSDVSDSSVHIYKSTDHGQSWIYYWGFFTLPKSIVTRVELVVGVPDSGFVYAFYIHPNNNGELQVLRMGRDTTGFWNFGIHLGPDTVTDFAACRDYSGWNYWLYATSHNGLRPGSAPPSRIFRSTDYAKNWAVVDGGFTNLSRPVLQAGAGRYIYGAAVPNQSFWKGWAASVYSTNYGQPGSWYSNSFHPDTFPLNDASISPAFTMPESEAVVWAVYSHSFQGTSDWDALFTYRNGMRDTWHAPAFLAGTSSSNEAWVDIKPYTVRGNTWVNASYGSLLRSNGVITVCRKYTNSAGPADWSDPLQINAGDAGLLGVPDRPRLCYSPGAPGTGAGCVFANQTRTALMWNSPWYTGVGESGDAFTSGSTRANLVRHVLCLPFSPRSTPYALVTIDGRKAMSLQPGQNDVRHLARGVYYIVREGSASRDKVLLLN